VPPKTRVSLLDLGRSEADEGFLIAARGAAAAPNPHRWMKQLARRCDDGHDATELDELLVQGGAFD
jgi:hypothetical protein